MTKELSNKIKVYNIFFIIFIFFFHCDARFYVPYMEPLSYIIGSLGLSFFFTISGYFMFAGMNDENALKRSLKRIKTLFLPYAFWNLVFYIYFIASDVYFRQSQPSKVLYRFLFQPYNDVLWYLFALFLFSIVAFLTYRVIKNVLAAWIFLCVISATIVIVFVINQAWVCEHISIGWWLTKITPYIPMYLFGGIVGLHYRDGLKVKAKSFAWPVFLLASFAVVLIKYKFDEVPIVYWLSMFFGPVILWKAIPENIFKAGKIIDFICEPSFLIYEFQLMSFWIWQSVFYRFDMTPAARERLICLCAYVFIYILFYACKAVCPHLLGIATGFRNGKDFTKKEKKA